MTIHHISPDRLTIDDVRTILAETREIQLSAKSKARISKCREYLDKKLESSDGLHYGINTGFGSLCNVKIPSESLQKLQENLVRSHACGMGDVVPEEITRLMLLLKIQSLSYGHSGVSVETVERLIFFYNNNLIPEVFTKGSLGASGDLAPLAHLSLPLIGEGYLFVNGERRPAKEVLDSFGLQPIMLQAKEGLALLNGTQFMLAYALWVLIESKKLLETASVAAALSIDAFDCKLEPFNHLIHAIRPHKGQVAIAKRILEILDGSSLAAHPKTQVQDPYAFRCVPQVHGATMDALEHIERVFETELNSVTDNPNIFPDEDLILSGGNFHGQPLAINLDYLAIAVAELGSISERRTYNLISGKRGLPEFLVKNPGLNSGLMIPQYTAASMVSENKQLCTPASVDSIISSNGQEDHVSMGANAAIKCFRMVVNVRNILAIEWLTAAQALSCRNVQTSPVLKKLLSKYREQIPTLENDRILHDDITTTLKFIQTEIS